MYSSWDTGVRPFLNHFCLFTPLKSKFWKNETPPEDFIILHMCTINDNHMMYGSWNMEHDGQNFFVILNRFLPSYQPKNPKSQI